MDLGLKEKVVIVGGASKGIGQATALAFAKEGAKVVICARNPELLDQAAREMQSENWGRDTRRGRRPRTSRCNREAGR